MWSVQTPTLRPGMRHPAGLGPLASVRASMTSQQRALRAQLDCHFSRGVPFSFPHLPASSVLCILVIHGCQLPVSSLRLLKAPRTIFKRLGPPTASSLCCRSVDLPAKG